MLQLTANLEAAAADSRIEPFDAVGGVVRGGGLGDAIGVRREKRGARARAFGRLGRVQRKQKSLKRKQEPMDQGSEGSAAISAHG